MHLVLGRTGWAGPLPSQFLEGKRAANCAKCINNCISRLESSSSLGMCTKSRQRHRARERAVLQTFQEQLLACSSCTALLAALTGMHSFMGQCSLLALGWLCSPSGVRGIFGLALLLSQSQQGTVPAWGI